MAEDFPIDIAQIVALFLESIFFGIHIVTFGLCIHVLLFSRHTRPNGGRRYRVLNPFFLVSSLLFVIAAFDEGLSLRHVLDAFIWYKGAGGAKEELADISYWVNVMKTVTYAAQASIADSILIYRCYVVYSRNWMIAAGLLVLWAACFILGAFICYIEFTMHTNAFLNSSQLSPFITSVLLLILSLNLIATTLIVFKIWKIQSVTARYVSSYGQGRQENTTLRRAMRIIIESGAIYSVSLITFFVVYIAGNNAQYGVSDCVVQIVGIAFNLMIVRLDQGRTIENRPARIARGHVPTSDTIEFATFSHGFQKSEVHPVELNIAGTADSSVDTEAGKDKLQRRERGIATTFDFDTHDHPDSRLDGIGS